MMCKTRGRTWYALTGAVLVLLIPLVAQSQTVTSPSQDAAKTYAYWTSARTAAAKPMPLRSVSGVPAAAPASTVRLTGDPVEVAATVPAGIARRASISGTVEVSPTIGAGSTIWYPYPPPFTLSVPVLDYLFVPLFPNTAVGKLFFSGPGGNFVCSAQSVTSAGSWGAGNRQTVVTAGHCCSDGAGSFYSNWMFQPAHLNGATPLGSWAAAVATVYTAWHTGSDLSVDYCALQMFTLGGQNINDSPTGALGYAASQPLPQSYVATGWPQAAPFTGGVLFYSSASDAETDTQQAGLLAFTHGIGSSMTGGSSGGAWIRKYQSAGAGGPSNQFNGLNSYKYTSPSRPDEMFGPYIETLFVNLLQVVATAPPVP